MLLDKDRLFSDHKPENPLEEGALEVKKVPTEAAPEEIEDITKTGVKQAPTIETGTAGGTAAPTIEAGTPAPEPALAIGPDGVLAAPETKGDALINKYVRDGKEVTPGEAADVLNDLLKNTQNQ
jgi:hypothetical protein